MTFEDRVLALEPLGFTTRQARFLATVALHSGYCLRRQYVAFAGVAYGKNVRDFLDSLVDRELAERFSVRADRGHIYHLSARTIYRLLKQEDNRNRREASAALIARKIMVLDYVLAHSEVEWLATEADKFELFADRFGIPQGDLPKHVYASSKPDSASTTRFFPHKLPVALVGDPPVAHFVYLAIEAAPAAFEAFLTDHAGLFGRLPAWAVVAVALPNAASLAACEAVFARFIAQPTVALVRHSEDLRTYFATRKAVDGGDLARLSVAEINRFRLLRDRFAGASFDTLYRDWLTRGDAAMERDRSSTAPARRSVGRLVTDTLPFDYSQFGSLPGVA
jgi:hypothetical protein